MDKEEAFKLMDRCSKCIEDGTTDTFRSYEEGVKDALNWVYCDGGKPMIMTDDEEDV